MREVYTQEGREDRAREAHGEKRERGITRREAGERLARERADEFVRVGESTYLVPSCSEPGVVYTVDLARDYCSCPDNRRNRHLKPCKHLWAGATVAQGLAGREEGRVREARGFYEVIGEGREHPELPVPHGCRYFSDCYGTPRYRVGFWRLGEFVRWEGESYLEDALAYAGELERERS